MEIYSYVPKDKRKKILLLCDDIRFTSGIATMGREMVLSTAQHFNWVNLAGAIQHPEQGKKFDLSGDTDSVTGIKDSSVYLYPVDGYGNPDIVRQIIALEKPDALMMFTDPRYWIWLFQMEHEIRTKIPIIYLNIWDDLPYPLYNKPYYESCDTLLAISKQTANINRVVLGDVAKDKVIKYVPHGINEKFFYPITEKEELDKLKEFQNSLLKRDYKFKILFNSRNIRRKSAPDLMLAFKTFLDGLPEEEAKECCLIMHTQVRDENGTDLEAVKVMMFGENNDNVIFSDLRAGADYMNYLYNTIDATALISSNEGWGLSLTESMMCGKMIIGNVSGGMQDQMRFEDENGEWVEFTEEFGSNHFGKYKKCGKWAIPVFPSNMSLAGSIPTPYIFDDRVDFRDAAEAIMEIYKMSTEERKERGLAGREWVLSDEAMMSSRNMGKNVIDGIEETFSKWKPRTSMAIIKTENLPVDYIKHIVAK